MVMLLTTTQPPHLERQVIRLRVDHGRARLRGATNEVHANVALRVEQPAWSTTFRSAHIWLQEQEIADHGSRLHGIEAFR